MQTSPRDGSLFSALVFLSVLWSGCGLDVVEFTITENGAAGGAAIEIPGLPRFGTSLTRSLTDKDVDPDDVDSMKLLECRIEMISQGGLTSDLSFLQKLEFHVSASGMPARLMAAQPSFPAGTRQADLEVTSGLELKDYLDAGSMTVTTEAPLVYPPPDIVEFEVTFRIRVDVNVV